MINRLFTIAAMSIIAGGTFAQSWPTASLEAKPGTRWWWLGSAVNESDLQWNMQEYSKAGLGALEITPLYGVQGNEKNELQFPFHTMDERSEIRSD